LSGFSFQAGGARYEWNVYLLDGVPIRDDVYSRLTVSPQQSAGTASEYILRFFLRASVGWFAIAAAAVILVVRPSRGTGGAGVARSHR